MKILIACSGSGGHVFPALAFAEYLNKQENAEILFLQTQKENIDRLIIEKGFKLVPFTLANVSFSSAIQGILSVFKLFFSAINSLIIIFKIKPDIVIGFGGYHSGPTLLAAHFLGFPTIIHEQNVLPGKANQLLSKFVDKVAISFEESRNYFKAKRIVLTGCPLRSEVMGVATEEARTRYNFTEDKFTILVMGGSQGSHNINLKFLEAISSLNKNDKLQIIHITGSKDCELVRKEYSRLKLNSLVFAFLKEIGYAYRLADVVIARAGASTISEIIALKIPAIIIPYPFARKHQSANAEVLVDAGAAILLDDEKLTSELLSEKILTLISDKDRLNQMRQGLYNLKILNAAENLSREALSLKRC